MVKRSFFLLAIFVACALSILAVPLLPPDNADELLEQSQFRLMNLEGLEIGFRSEITLAGSGLSDFQEGKICFSRGRYAILTPDEAIFCDLNKQWIVDRHNQDYQVFPYDPQQDLTLEVIFQLFRNKGRAVYEGVVNLDGTPHHKVFIPLSDSKLDHSRAVVWIHPETFFMSKVVLMDRQQTTTTYWFFDIVEIADASGLEFNFNPDKY